MTDSPEQKQPAPPEHTSGKKETDDKGKKPKPSAKEAQQLSKQLDEAEATVQKQGEQLNELNARLLRTLAEYDNYRKRTQREKDQLFPEAIKTAAEAFLPVLDNFERALAAPTEDEEFKKGVAMIFSAMQEAFNKLGIEEIEAQGQPFDPTLHNAVMHVEDDSLPESTVCEVFAKGYRLGELVIRHAMVKVAN